MPNALALAAVTATLQALLRDALADTQLDALQPIEVSTGPPDAVVGEDEKNRLNLYLWKAAPNPAFAADGLPAFNAGGMRSGVHRLGLELSYLMTATGTADLNAEIMLGHGVRAFHETPVLSSNRIAAVLAPPAAVAANGTMRAAALRVIEASDLADQIEGIRITPSAATDDDLTKVWPAFNAPLRMSFLYRVSVVLLETAHEIAPASPVRTPSVQVTTLRRPQIARIVKVEANVDLPGAAIHAGDRIAILGRGLVSPDMQVTVAGSVLSPAESATERMLLDLPSDQPPGPVSLQIAHMGRRSDQSLYAIETSNTVSCRVAATLTAADFTSEAGPTQVAGRVEVTLAQPVDPERFVRLRLSLDGAPVAAATHEPRSQATADLTFAFAGLAAGPHEAVLSVDGVESPPVALEVVP